MILRSQKVNQKSLIHQKKQQQKVNNFSRKSQLAKMVVKFTLEQNI